MRDNKSPVMKQLMEELAHEDKALAEASEAFKRAATRYQVASRRYAAVRDLVLDRLGHSPYKKGIAEEYGVEFPTGGRERFIYTAAGEAVVAALKESGEPLTLEQIIEVLRGGGLTSAYETRAVNAALMKTKGIVKMEEGKYVYVDLEELGAE
jgi:hypothetical protein